MSACGRQVDAFQYNKPAPQPGEVTMPRSWPVRAALSVLLAAVFTPSALAQSYPSREIHLVVGYSAGSGPDITARRLAEALIQSDPADRGEDSPEFVPATSH